MFNFNFPNVTDSLLFVRDSIVPFLFYLIPYLIPAILIYLGVMLLRLIFTRYILKLLMKLSGKTGTTLDNHIIAAFERPIRQFFTLLGLYLALLYFPFSPEHELLMTKIFRSFLIILVASGFYNLIGRYSVFHKELEETFGINIDKILVPLFSKVLKFLVLILAATMIIQEEWDYDLNSLIAGLGLGGLAFALAAKDTVSNVFGGIVIITDKPFSIGDWISTPNVEGVVEDINFRSTKLRTFAQAMVTVPNATLANESITNWTRMGKRRITFNLGVTYNTPKVKIEKCVNEIQQMLENHPEIHQETIFVTFNSFNESSLDIFLYFFTNTTDWGDFLKIKEDINFKIMEILEREEVSVAFPSRSLYLETPIDISRRDPIK